LWQISNNDSSTSDMISSPRVEPLYVLYGSQTGNSEGAAKDFCAQLPTIYTPSYFEQHGLPVIQVKAQCLQLDDFLELHHAAFTKCIVIFVSSYGVGQAPLGAYRFRELCDFWAQHQPQDEHSSSSSLSSSTKALQGLQYAICGLGDSTYTTKFVNPTRIDRGLTAAGAQRIGELAKADAHGTGEQSQDATIAQWMQEIWLPLAHQLTKDVDPELVNTQKMQEATIPLLIQLDPDYKPPKESLKHMGSSSREGDTCTTPIVLVGIAAVGILAAIVAVKFQ
jgi:sulfite reductase alpha subunit-like flavoprotein